LHGELVAELQAGIVLDAHGLPNPQFVAEAKDHLAKLRLNARAGLLAAEMLRAQRPALEDVVVDAHGRSGKVAVRGRAVRADPAAVSDRNAALTPVEAESRANPYVVHGDRVATDLNGVFVLENTMDAFLEWAHATTSAWLPLAPEAAGLQKAAIIALLAIITVNFSPTMTAAVISETGARGRLSDLVLAIVVLADAAVLVLFSLALPLARAAFAETAGGPHALVQAAWQIGGAVAFGTLTGALFALYLRYVGREVTLVLLGVAFALSQVGATQRFEPLVAAMAAGIVIQNASVAQGDALKVALQRGALPVLVVFFVAVGASLQLDALGAVGSVAIMLAIVRILLIRLGIEAGLRISSVDRHIGAHAWTGLISQAGITLGLVAVVAAEFPTWGPQLQVLLVALIAIDELVGPTTSVRASPEPGIWTRIRRGRCSWPRTANPTCTTSPMGVESTARTPRGAWPLRSTPSCASAEASGSRTAAARPTAMQWPRAFLRSRTCDPDCLPS
jgi:hypothetical protein